MSNVSIVVASRHGSTREIGERIADTLRSRGIEAVVASPADPPDSAADAFVVGSAVYIGGWMKEAEQFVRRHEMLLRSRPVWLFSSGPLGSERPDVANVEDLANPKVVEELSALVDFRGHRVFFGAYDPSEPPAGLSERLVRMMPAAKELLQPGDFRDWAAIEAWAGEIADALTRPVPSA